MTVILLSIFNLEKNEKNAFIKPIRHRKWNINILKCILPS